MKKYIEEQKNESLELYKKNYARMVQEYKNEKKTTGDYNGRQLLELIQNADDAKSDKVLLKLNTKRQSLSISNKGESFTKEGYRSLMLSGLSAKIKKTFIGNKGLGFRSITNWSESIKIHSNNLSVEFSEKIRNNTYLELYPENRRNEISEEFRFPKTTTPFPFLAIPEIKDYSNSDYTTTIEIQYKNENGILEDIINQVKELKPEVLLFLNNIKSIHFEGFQDNISDIQDIIIAGKKEIGKITKISNKQWIIYEKNGELDGKYQDKDSTEQEFYQVKIAIPQNFANETNVLFTFFPTKVDIGFPFVVHGTFDLDSSRNQLLKTAKNEFVLEKLIELIVETATKISQKETSWEAIKLLRQSSQNTVLKELGFYDSINSKIKELALFPCVDGQYRKIENTIQYCNDFSTFISANKYPEIFAELFIPIDDELKKWLENDLAIEFNKYDKETLVSKIDLLSDKLATNDERAELVYLLTRNSEFHSNEQKYSVLINEEKTITKEDISVFTPPTTISAEFNIPDFVKIDFLNKEFYQKLIKKFDLDDHSEKARALQREIKDITNIRSFEPASVIDKIINESNRSIEKTSNQNEKNAIIRKMIKSLFINYKDLKDSTRPDTTKVQIITKSEGNDNAGNLYLSSDYPAGILTEDIFGDIFPENFFVASRETLGLSNEDKDEVEKFLTDFLNVNIHTKFKKDEHPEYDYEKFIFGFITKPNNYSESEISVARIENTDLIFEKISLEQMLLWLLKDKSIFKQIDDKRNDDSFKYKEARKRYFHCSIDIKPSYIKYQIITQSSYKFAELFIANEKLSFINDFKVDYKHPLFKKYDISEKEINDLLLELGAKKSFENFTIERISTIISGLKEKHPEGKNAQKIYQLAFEHYKKHKANLNLAKGTFLFADKGTELGYYSINEIYYADNITLPKKIIYQHSILKFPKRIGEAQVSKFFGIKTFKDYSIEIKSYELNKELTTNINEHLAEIKPYLLAIRLSKIAADKQKQINSESGSIKNLEIKVCSSINCIIEGSEIELEDFEFIQSENKSYIRLESISDIQKLKKIPEFSDVIAEIVAITFKVNEDKNDFRTYFREDIEYTKYCTIKEYGEELLQEAKELLDMSDYQRNFWSTVFSVKGRNLDPKQKLKEQIAEAFNADFNSIPNKIDYESLSMKGNIEHLKTIFSELNLSIEDFNNNSSNKIDLSEYHSEQLKNYFNSNEKHFKYLLWLKLNNEPLEERKTFLDLLSNYRKSDFIREVSSKNRYTFESDLEKEYKQFIKEKFCIEFQQPKHEIDLDKTYKANKNKFSLKEQDVIEENTKTKSLLYFDNSIASIKALIKPFIEKEATINEAEDADVENKEITEIKNNFTVTATEISDNPNKKGAYVHSSLADKNKKKKGRKLEEKVYEKLVEKYGEKSVIWASKDDDSLGYDIKYEKDNKNWFYVEVKAFDNEKFYISKNEKLFGEENKDNYEIWLVKGNELYPVELFNKIKDQDYNIEATEFIISLEIEENES